MDTLILEDVRCFHERHELPLAPLTILVGENSTGKSTILAAARLAWDISSGNLTPDFADEPFDWGAYDQIAHCRRGPEGRAKSFTLGLTASSSTSPLWKEFKFGDVLYEAKFVQKGAQPVISEYRIHAKPYSLSWKRTSREVTVVMRVGKKTSRKKTKSRPTIDATPIYIVFQVIAEATSFSEHEKVALQALAYGFRAVAGDRPYAIAPIRTKPRRTHDRRSEVPHPEGNHVPMVLAQMKSSNPKSWAELKDMLSGFGAESGLFRSVDIKRLGRKSSDPFQLQVKVAGQPRNLMDVGYGISQVLPVVVDCLTGDRDQLLLMQQPEVHLHPRAQAQLGTFLGQIVKSKRNQVIIETHSDYLIDRVRLDIRDGKHLKPKDVSLLYCERTGEGVKVHRIEIDAHGNLVDVPSGYRRFFMDEEKRFFEG